VHWRTWASGVAAAALVSGLVVVGALSAHGPSARGATDNARALAHLSVCRGPAGTAYIADAGYDAFSAVHTANCKVIQTYNVDDPGNPGDEDDTNYSSTDEAVVESGSRLYFADTGDSNVAVINAAKLTPSNYNPAEVVINSGLFPEDLAVTAHDAGEIWVADTGPQTSTGSPSGVSVISTATRSVVASIPLSGATQQIVFSPDGQLVYVTTSSGLFVIATVSRHVVDEVTGLDDPHGVAVSPNGDDVYVTNAGNGTVSVIDTTTDTVSSTIPVGEMPWQIALSADGDEAYVADADSNAVSVIDTSTDVVSAPIPVAGDPDTLALTPDGSELWVGEDAAGSVAVIDTSNDTEVATVELGVGFEPTGIVFGT
jgi:YVTN family beta-propeller protein